MDGETEKTTNNNEISKEVDNDKVMLGATSFAIGVIIGMIVIYIVLRVL